MFFLPNLKELGTVELVTVYHRYDIPRTFLVEAKKVGKCVVIWTDEDELYDSWYYAPVNEDEILRLESGYIQLRDVFCHKQLYSIKTSHSENVQHEFAKISVDQIDLEALPPEGFGLKIIGEGVYDVEKRPIESFLLSSDSHEVRINRRRSKKPIEWEPIEYIFGSWKRLHNSLLTTAQNISDSISIIPGVANTGSYKMQFQSSHNEDVYEGVHKVFNAIRSVNGSLEKLRALNIDLSILEQLLSNLTEYNLQFEVRTNSGALVESLDFKLIEDTISALNEYNQQKISSDLVPQANEISRIVTYIEKKSKGIPYTAESENIEPRQISYYKAASDMLGFTKRGALTPIGWRLSEQEDELEIYKILMERFETSRCGWAWLKYSDVRTALELEPDSAEHFLRKWSTGLSETTLLRRASTLRKWPIVFREKLKN